MRGSRRGFLAVLAAAGIAMLGATPAAGVDGSTAAPPGTEFVSSQARTVDGQVVDDAAAKKEVTNYWTPERMREAIPADAPRTVSPDASTPAAVGTPRTVASPVPASDAGTNAVPTSAPAVGRVFYVDPLTLLPRTCSAAVVSSDKGKLVSTAGHCVFSHNSAGQPVGWMLNWMFAPGYNGGVAVAGTWVAENLTTRTDYIATGSSGTDIGMAIMAATASGTRIMHVVGGNGLIVNQPHNVVVTAIGYPAEGNYSGFNQVACIGQAGMSTSTQIVLFPCDFTPGASGGPWMVLYDPSIGYGYVNSVSSAIYCVPNQPCAPNATYGVYFDDWMAGLYLYSESIST